MWGGLTPAPRGYQITYLQSDCYRFLASALPDYSLCDKVRPLRRGVKDGTKITPDYCRKHPEFASSVPSVYTVIPMMQNIGYDERALRDFQYLSLYNNPIREAYDRLRKEESFAERVRRGPTYDEPVAPVKNRTANDLEYVYEMFANDTNDSGLCDKISPNAMSERPTSRDYPLRLTCYGHIAFNKMDTGECEKLPTHLAEECIRNVQAMRPNPDARRMRWGPEFPPSFASFQRGLHELGYDPLLPELTYSEYEDFVLFLAYEAHPSERVEFIERVNAMN